jgi:DNA replication protein DnaC
MAYDGMLLARARDKLDEIRAENEAEHQRRLSLIYSRIPEIGDIDRRMQQQMRALMGLAIRRSGDTDGEIAALESENLALSARRAELLTAGGYPVNYLDEIYSCPKCRDTGFLGGGVCSCLRELYNRELTAELGVLLRDGGDTFEKFDLTLYDDRPDETGESPRAYMRQVYDTCREYASGFGPGSPNMLFQGGTGLGKTFLSACIAKVAADRGFSVCYDTASSALEYFETKKFSRDPSAADGAAVRVGRMLQCDLMILDDLGTEMVTPMSLSALYTLINTRLVDRRVTIISTNLADNELARRYTDQINSRLDGEYYKLPFVGRDIRLVKKERDK